MPNALETATLPTLAIKPRITLPEAIQALAYAIALTWMNAYVCRDMFVRYTPRMNSMQGFWIAMSRLAGERWFQSDWWRYWDCGSPVELIYAPLVPSLSAGIAAIRGVPDDVAFQTVSGLVYCLGPLTLFVMAWLLTRAPGYSFAAAALYSLTSPSQLLTPDTQFSLQHFWDARRLYLMAVWDETPHMAALAVLPLVILFLSLSIRKRRMIDYVASILAISACCLLSEFGAVLIALVCLCLLFVLRREQFLTNLLVIAGIGAFAYAICSPFFSLAHLHSVGVAAGDEPGGTWSFSSWTALAIVALGWALIWRFLPRWTNDWRLHFFALFAWTTASVPLLSIYLNRTLLPQPNRYKIEMEFALALLIPFAARPLFQKFPRSVQACVLLLLIALAGEQIINLRHYAKISLQPIDVTKTIEYRTAMWTQSHLPGVRVMLPGSIGQWANAFTDVPQLAGGSYSVAYNRPQQLAKAGIYRGGGNTDAEDARVSTAWLKAFGAGAIAVVGPKSTEFWHPFEHPNKFNGRLPLLWREDDVSIYRVPGRSDSLAHIVPESALVRHTPSGPRDVTEIENYVAALDTPSLPDATFHWAGKNRIDIQANLAPGQAVSVQVTHYPGWHAKVNSVDRPVQSDGLGLVWLLPQCTGPCHIQLDYNGGAELIFFHALSALAITALAAWSAWLAWRALRMRRRPAV